MATTTTTMMTAVIGAFFFDSGPLLVDAELHAPDVQVTPASRAAHELEYVWPFEPQTGSTTAAHIGGSTGAAVGAVVGHAPWVYEPAEKPEHPAKQPLENVRPPAQTGA